MKNIICYFFSFFAAAVVLWQYSSALFSAADNASATVLPDSDDFYKKQAAKQILVLALLHLFLFAVSIAEIRWLNAFLFCAVYFIYFVTQYRLKWLTALFHSVTLTAVMSMCELILFGIILRYSPHFFSAQPDSRCRRICNGDIRHPRRKRPLSS